MLSRPIQFNVYKGKTGKMGALQMNLKLPSEYNLDGKDKPGCIFLEMTSATAPDVYDWENKIVFALGLVDIYKLLFGLRTMNEGGNVNLVHDPNAGTDSKGSITKTLNVSSPKGVSTGVFVTLTEKRSDITKTHKVGLDGAETLCLATLLQAAVPIVLGWM